MAAIASRAPPAVAPGIWLGPTFLVSSKVSCADSTVSDILEEARLIADTGRLLDSPVLSAWEDTDEIGRVGAC